MDTISERLKFIRIEKRFTQAELADLLQIKRQTIANIESGNNNPSIDFISKLIENLNVNANWLIAGVGKPFNPPKFEDVEDELTLKVESLLKKHNLI